MGTALLLRERSIFKGEGTNLGELSYGLKVETDKGIYTFGIYETPESEMNEKSPKSLLALEDIIEEGDIVRFATARVVNDGGRTKKYLHDDKTGNIPSNYVSVVKKKEE